MARQWVSHPRVPPAGSGGGEEGRKRRTRGLDPRLPSPTGNVPHYGLIAQLTKEQASGVSWGIGCEQETVPCLAPRRCSAAKRLESRSPGRTRGQAYGCFFLRWL